VVDLHSHLRKQPHKETSELFFDDTDGWYQ